MGQAPNAYLTRRSRPRETQKPGYAEQLWRQAGPVLLAERMRLNTQRLTAVLLREKALSNVWWPLKLRDDLDGTAAKALLLWLNSTLGVLMLLGIRAETEGAWVDFKKPTLHALPVLDVRKLSREQLRTLAAVFDDFSATPFEPLRSIHLDPARKAIDDILCRVLALPDLAGLRQQLASEPILSMQPLTQRLLEVSPAGHAETAAVDEAASTSKLAKAPSRRVAERRGVYRRRRSRSV